MKHMLLWSALMIVVAAGCYSSMNAEDYLAANPDAQLVGSDEDGDGLYDVYLVEDMEVPGSREALDKQKAVDESLASIASMIAGISGVGAGAYGLLKKVKITQRLNQVKVAAKGVVDSVEKGKSVMDPETLNQFSTLLREVQSQVEGAEGLVNELKKS